MTKQIVVIGGLLAAVWAVFRFSNVLPSVIIAIILAYILTPAVNWLYRRTRMPRTIVLILVYLLLLVLIGLTPVLVVPGLVRQFNELNLDLQRIINSLVEALSQPIVILGFSIELPNVYDQIAAAVQNLLSPFATGAVAVVVSVASSLVWLIFILVVSFYLIKDSAKIGRYLRGLLPHDNREEFEELARRIGIVWNAFFRGQLLLGVVVGTAVAIITSALGLRNGLTLGLLAGVLEVIPNFGPVVAAVPAVLLALFQGSMWLPVSNGWFAIIIIGAYFVIQQVENNYLVPRIIGGSVKLHPAVVIIGAVAGATIGGILGILLAAPTMATLRILIRYSMRKVQDLEPFGEGLAPVVEQVVHRGGMIGGHDVEAILFDLDGTLVDADKTVLERMATRLEGIEPLLPSGDAKRAARRTAMATEKPANALLGLLERVGLESRVPAMRQRLSRVQAQPPAEQFQLVEGVAELLDYLNHRVKLGIVTTRRREEVDAFLAQFGYQHRFQVVVTREDVDRVKPAPDPITLAAERLGVPVQRCAVVGDTRADVEAANQAGAISLGVLCGLGDREDLEEAELVLDCTTDLREWV